MEEYGAVKPGVGMPAKEQQQLQTAKVIAEGLDKTA